MRTGYALDDAVLGGAFLASMRTGQASKSGADHEQVALADAGCTDGWSGAGLTVFRALI